MSTEQIILAAHVTCWVVLVPAVFATLFSVAGVIAASEDGEGHFPAKVACWAFAVVCVALFGVVATW